MKERIAIFDFDKTLTNKDSFFDFLHFSHGTFLYFIGLARLSRYLFLYKMGFIDKKQFKEIIFKYFFSDTPYETYKYMANRYSKERLHLSIHPMIKNILDNHREKGDTLIMITASFSEWIDFWAKENGFSEIFASKFKVVKGNIDGEIIYHCQGKEKKEVLVQYLKSKYNGYILFGYGNKEDSSFIEMCDYKNYY